MFQTNDQLLTEASASVVKHSMVVADGVVPGSLNYTRVDFRAGQAGSGELVSSLSPSGGGKSDFYAPLAPVRVEDGIISVPAKSFINTRITLPNILRLSGGSIMTAADEVAVDPLLTEMNVAATGIAAGTKVIRKITVLYGYQHTGQVFNDVYPAYGTTRLELNHQIRSDVIQQLGENSFSDAAMKSSDTCIYLGNIPKGRLPSGIKKLELYIVGARTTAGNAMRCGVFRSYAEAAAMNIAGAGSGHASLELSEGERTFDMISDMSELMPWTNSLPCLSRLVDGLNLGVTIDNPLTNLVWTVIGTGTKPVWVPFDKCISVHIGRDEGTRTESSNMFNTVRLGFWRSDALNKSGLPMVNAAKATLVTGGSQLAWTMDRLVYTSMTYRMASPEAFLAFNQLLLQSPIIYKSFRAYTLDTSTTDTAYTFRPFNHRVHSLLITHGLVGQDSVCPVWTTPFLPLNFELNNSVLNRMWVGTNGSRRDSLRDRIYMMTAIQGIVDNDTTTISKNLESFVGAPLGSSRQLLGRSDSTTAYGTIPGANDVDALGLVKDLGGLYRDNMMSLAEGYDPTDGMYLGRNCLYIPCSTGGLDSMPVINESVTVTMTNNLSLRDAQPFGRTTGDVSITSNRLLWNSSPGFGGWTQQQGASIIAVVPAAIKLQFNEQGKFMGLSKYDL